MSLATRFPVGTGQRHVRFTKLAEEPAFVQWYSKWSDSRASPGIFNALRRVANDIDVRAVLPTITFSDARDARRRQ